MNVGLTSQNRSRSCPNEEAVPELAEHSRGQGSMGSGGATCSSRGDGCPDMLGEVSCKEQMVPGLRTHVLFQTCCSIFFRPHSMYPPETRGRNQVPTYNTREHSRHRLAYPFCAVPRATEQAMSRELKGESGAMQTWLETSITGLHAFVGRIQV